MGLQNRRLLESFEKTARATCLIHFLFEKYVRAEDEYDSFQSQFKKVRLYFANILNDVYKENFYDYLIEVDNRDVLNKFDEYTFQRNPHLSETYFDLLGSLDLLINKPEQFSESFSDFSNKVFSLSNHDDLKELKSYDLVVDSLIDVLGSLESSFDFNNKLGVAINRLDFLGTELLVSYKSNNYFLHDDLEYVALKNFIFKN